MPDLHQIPHLDEIAHHGEYHGVGKRIDDGCQQHQRQQHGHPAAEAPTGAAQGEQRRAHQPRKLHGRMG